MKKLLVMLLLGGLAYVAWRRCAGCCSSDESGWCNCGASDDTAHEA